jgi:hypothetical protein
MYPPEWLLHCSVRLISVLLKRNIVATVNLDCRLDLKTIALHARNAEYNPKVLLLCPVYMPVVH